MTEHWGSLRGGGDPDFQDSTDDPRQLASRIPRAGGPGNKPGRLRSVKDQLATRRIDPAVAEPLRQLLRLAATGSPVSRAEIEQLSTDPDASRYQVDQWRARVAAAVRDIHEIRAAGSNGPARQTADAYVGELGDMLAAPVESRASDAAGDDPRALAGLVPRHGAPRT
ncbi:hypothetical protein [Pseudonocardia sp. H11422]|uniref:hypothetical protein n=1 Tax=Pseudonocardia sp. H11422 TaxID=2835866 RepID=UPI001BDD2B81|nr:hypothetical protein [Pseudonocardia sp. H11422]